MKKKKFWLNTASKGLNLSVELLSISNWFYVELFIYFTIFLWYAFRYVQQSWHAEPNATDLWEPSANAEHAFCSLYAHHDAVTVPESWYCLTGCKTIIPKSSSFIEILIYYDDLLLICSKIESFFQVFTNNPLFAGNPQLQEQMRQQLPVFLQQVCSVGIVVYYVYGL